MNNLSWISNHRAYSQLSDMVHGTMYYKYHIEGLELIVCDWGGTFPTWKCWVLCTVRIHVPCDNKQEQGTGYTDKYLQDSFLTMPFVHTTRLGNRITRFAVARTIFSKMIKMFCLHFTKTRSGFHSGKFDRSADL